MKTRLLLVLSFVLLMALTHVSATAADRSAPDSVRIERLAGLCKLWGLVKYFHPYLGYKDIDWDAVLVQTIPKVNAASTPEEYKAAINYMLSFLKDPNTHIVSESGMSASGGSKKAQLAEPRLRWIGKDVAVVVCNNLDAFTRPFEKADLLREIFTEASKANAIIFDLRREPLITYRDAGSVYFSLAFLEAFPVLLGEDLPMALFRYRMHSGYGSQSVPNGDLYSALIVKGGESIVARGQSGTMKPMAFLINSGTLGLHQLLGGIQSAGLASVIQEGEAFSEGEIDPLSISLPDDLIVTVRSSEFVSPDGRIGFHPTIVPVSADKSDDSSPAMLAALKAVRKAESARRAPAAPSRSGAKLENPYINMTYPAKEYRLLSLFRFWNVIQYFFPYKHLIDEPWENALTEYIPKMEAAENALGYTLTVAEMVAEIQDSHGIVLSPAYDQHLGTFFPPIITKSIEGQTVVTHIFDDPSVQSSGLKVGDVITSIDAEEIDKRRERLGRVFAASTPQSLRWRVSQRLLAGAENSKIKLIAKDDRGRITEATLTRSIKSQPGLRVGVKGPSRPFPAFTVISEGFGYIDLVRLTTGQVDSAFEAIKGTSGLIFDMRGYPNGTAWTIAPRLTNKRVTTTQIGIPQILPGYYESGFTFPPNLSMYQTTAPGTKWRYTGKVVVLINEEAVSQAEHSCLYLEAAAGATFIGSATSGADGGVADTVLPGGIRVYFTAVEVRHSDGRQLQRLGIQPHIKVEPTIAAIREGRDEVMERAIQFLSENR